VNAPPPPTVGQTTTTEVAEAPPPPPPPPVNTPPDLNPSFALVNGTGRCIATTTPSDVIRVIATAQDADGIAKVTGSFLLVLGPGWTVSSPPTRMTLQSNGFYAYPGVDLRAGTFTFVVTATDTTGLARTATVEVVSTTIAPGLCALSSSGWTFDP
jgi:hypothetical protein